MAEQAERAFARTFLNTLATQPVAYADDFQQPPEQSLRRVPVLPVCYRPCLEHVASVFWKLTYLSI